MTTGQRILQARQEAGLSQRQLAGDTITRNMLSLLEHDQANPSLETLRYLSRQLQKPVSYFLGEEQAGIPGYDLLTQARTAWDQGEYEQCRSLLEQLPDSQVLDPEREILWAEAVLALAEKALEEGRRKYCHSLMEQSAERLGRCPYSAETMLIRCHILQARSAEPQQRSEAVSGLPNMDELLMLRSETTDPVRAGVLLEACETRGVRWQILRGDSYFRQEHYEPALECYKAAEAEQPDKVRRAMQLCYAALGNYEMAYRYATQEQESPLTVKHD